MATPTRSLLRTDAIRSEVRSLAYGGLVLGVDLQRLDEVSRVDAPDAVIFYAARILEMLAALSVTRISGMPSANVFSNLVMLSEIGLLTDGWAAQLHALRRLGNGARHGYASAEVHDAEVAVALLERTLTWYFVEGPTGPRLSSIARDVPLIESSEVIDVLSVVAAPAAERVAAAARSSAVLRSAFLTGLVAEAWIRVGGVGPAQALELVERGLAAFPADLRLRHMRGWALRLVGRPDESIDALELLVSEGHADDETLGILAGTYKRVWANDRTRRDALVRAKDLYARAWKHSEKKSVYAGVNAAATALLAGTPDRSRSIASDVVALYERRRSRHAAMARMGFSGYWDVVTLAEAELLSGDVDRARRRYGDAFRRYRDRPTHVDSTKLQLSLILPGLGLTADAEAFLQEPATSTGATPMSTYEPRPIATSGLELPDALREAAERLAEHVHDVWAQRRMAEGWRYGSARDDEARTHPGLVPYADLSESEKEYDRATATETIKALLEMGFRIQR